MNKSQIYSVKNLNKLVKEILSTQISQIWLVGEISNFVVPASGHWYFTLKDETAQVKCAMFKGANMHLAPPKNGQKVIVLANVTLYEARGEYQIIIEKLELSGIGLLQQKFEELKNKLNAEGLFDSTYKKPLPKYINRVGVITSSTGAALHDICNILKRRDPSIEIIIYPSLVQGSQASDNIAKMIALANARDECDVLIVGRGGGSIEDLWPFNEEPVARAIFNSTLPIISAVGHEIDFTIADFVSDVRAATPSAAAEIVSKEATQKLKDLTQLNQQMSMAFDHYLLLQQATLQKLAHALKNQHPKVKLNQQKHQITIYFNQLQRAIAEMINKKKWQCSQIENKLQQSPFISKSKQLQHELAQKQQQLFSLMTQTLTQKKHALALASSQLHTVSPLATLERGYSVTRDSEQKVIKNASQIKKGDQIITNIKKAIITSTVTSINQKS